VPRHLPISLRANHCTIPACTTATVTTTVPVVVSVVEAQSNREAGVSVYAFDDATYSGYSGTTETSGQVTFTLPMGSYRFRADKDGTEFWSGGANQCMIPGCTTATMTTTIPVVVAVEDTNGKSEAGLPVYVFDGTAYTGYNDTSSVSGTVTFTLPMGDYRFRANKNGTQFWSGESDHCTIPGCTQTTVTTTIPAMVPVVDEGGDPEPSLPVYVFDWTTYTSKSGTTGVSGTVTFTLSMGDYRFRADKSGEQYWSAGENHWTVPGCTAGTITITGQAMGTPGVMYTSSSRASGVGVLAAPVRWPAPDTVIAVDPATFLSSPAQNGGTLVSRVISYTYDPLNRLTGASYSDGTFYEYQYDEIGDREAMTTTEGSVAYTYDAANRLTSVGGVSYTYDDNGNLTSDGILTYTYDVAGRLVGSRV